MMLRKLDFHVQKKESELYFVPFTKINSKWIKDLNVRPKTKTPRRKHRGKLHEIGFCNDFLAKTPKARTTKTKMNNWNYLKLDSCM